MVKWIVVMKIQPRICLDEIHEKNPVRLAATGIWTRDLPNACLMGYRGATSLGVFFFCGIYTNNISLLNYGVLFHYFGKLSHKI